MASGGTDQDFDARLALLPQELKDIIQIFTLTINAGKVSFTKNYKPLNQLQVNQASRKLLPDFYTNTTFCFKHVDLLDKWLRNTGPTYRDMLPSIHYTPSFWKRDRDVGYDWDYIGHSTANHFLNVGIAINPAVLVIVCANGHIKTTAREAIFRQQAALGSLLLGVDREVHGI
ncbi:uncharacterized protein LTR77_008950 [Saxophila tyrrhenica]|uniref:Beta-lactamase-related domain-containing protein n=1 Tax=Saxophila tyrrhenica TaxID=1690608 RepID=A0AAV9P205_9PEZI|nr:hypothetical protein LTR77_008950 [Saxophila tyrrhenica]